MKNFKDLVEETGVMLFKEVTKEPKELLENEYYALMVTSTGHRDSPYIRGMHQWDIPLVGVEKTSGENGWYVSKKFTKRSKSFRGITFICEVLDLSKCCEL